MTQQSGTRIWQPQFECMPREEMQALQLERLRETLARLRTRVPFYRDRLDKAGVTPDAVRTLDDVRRIPFTTKGHLREHYPYGLLSVPLSEVARVHASTGTTGQPTVVAYTRRDLETWADLVARFVVSAGVRSDDLVHIAFSYGLFTGGFGLHYGVERMGAGIIPVAAGNTERQVKIIKEFRPTALVCTPSYSLHVAEVMESMGVKPSDTALRIGLFGAEFWSESLRREIETRLGISATDNYGLSEVLGPGVSGECEYKNGMHLQEDHFLIEHIDPKTEKPVAPGEVGELIITPLTREAFSVVRYRTRDLCTLIEEPCPCGRTTRRMTKVIGRTDDMLIVRGVNLFPSQIETVLLDVGDTEPHYQIVLGREGALDTMEIKVEMPPQLFSDEMKELHQFERDLEKRLQTELGVSFKLTLVEPGTLERSMGKAKRVIDLRSGQ